MRVSAKISLKMTSTNITWYHVCYFQKSLSKIHWYCAMTYGKCDSSYGTWSILPVFDIQIFCYIFNIPLLHLLNGCHFQGMCTKGLLYLWDIIKRFYVGPCFFWISRLKLIEVITFNSPYGRHFLATKILIVLVKGSL